jgi:hypothetical protein
MRAWQVLTAVALGSAVAGCYTSDAPLLTDANSVAPYAKISFREESAKDLAVLTREGLAYTLPAEDGSGKLTLRFMATDRPDWYVAQVAAPPSGTGLDLMYAAIRIDPAKRQAQSFKAIAADPKESAGGFHLCGDLVCVDDVRAYIASAFAFADRGGAPDAVYEIAFE